jgi:hypothetical protein
VSGDGVASTPVHTPRQLRRSTLLTASRSVFPKRGQPDNDREYRHPRMRADKGSRRDPTKIRRSILDVAIPPLSASAGVKAPQRVDEWDYLPPVPEIVDAVNMFTRHYFQLGFIPKETFTQRLQQDPRSISVFLLLGILSISSRFTPSLVRRHGNGMSAAERFMELGSTVALHELYKEPTLERCQGFYLLGIAQQGSGLRNKSYVRGVGPFGSPFLVLTEADQSGHRRPNGISDAPASRRDIRPTAKPDARTQNALRKRKKNLGTSVLKQP